MASSVLVCANEFLCWFVRNNPEYKSTKIRKYVNNVINDSIDDSINDSIDVNFINDSINVNLH
jgi:hypothetical protein